MGAIIKRLFSGKTLMGFIFLTLLLSSIYVAIELTQAPTVAPAGATHTRVKSDYVLMLLQCIVGVFAMLLPGLIQKRFHMSIPSNMLVIYALFLYCAIYLGEVRSFYYNVPHWDTILHTFSGVMLGALGFSIISFLNKTDQIPINLSPLFIAAFAFCFSVTLGVFWEIYEFLGDIILGTNMQKFALENKELLVGQAALADTMKDLIVDSIGAFFMAAIGFVSLKYKKNWLESLLLKFNYGNEGDKTVKS